MLRRIKSSKDDSAGPESRPSQENTAKKTASWVSSFFAGDSGEQRPLFNVFVYRLSSMRLSRKSTNLSVFSAKGAQFIERTTFSLKHWLMLLVEMLISFSWTVIRQRRINTPDLIRRGVTERQETIDFYFRRGCSSFFCILVGFAADTYLSIYHFAIFNVAFHFFVITLLFMELIISSDDYPLYSDFFSGTVGLSVIPLKATDFARLVYGLELLGRKNIAVVIKFIFLSLWMNERSAGGVLQVVVLLLKTGWVMQVRLSFVFTGFALAVFIFCLRPTSADKIRAIHGIGKAVIGVIITALWTKYQVHGAISRDTWVDFAEVKYDRAVITKTKQVLRLYLLLLPTVGFGIFVASRNDFYDPLWASLEPTGLFVHTGVQHGHSIITLMTMGGVQFVFFPIVHAYRKKRHLLQRFVCGYVMATFCFFYTSVALYMTQPDFPNTFTGSLRFYNARLTPIRFFSRDLDVTTFDRVVEPKSALSLSVKVKKVTLIRMAIVFDARVNYTMYFSVMPNRIIGYIALDPPNIARFGYYLPLRDAFPGYNDPSLATVFFTNTLPYLATLAMEELVEEKVVSRHYVNCSPGHLNIIQLEPGRYEASIRELEIRNKQTRNLRLGDKIGYIVHTNTSDTLLEVDEFIRNPDVSAMIILGVAIPQGIALTMSYVTIRALLMYNTPEGLEGIGFGFLECLENMASLIFYLGYSTFHEFPSPFTVLVYGTFILLLLFSNVFVMVKYSELYRW